MCTHPYAETAEDEVLVLLADIDAPDRLGHALAGIGLGPLTGQLLPGASPAGLRLTMLYFALFCLHEDWVARWSSEGPARDLADLTAVYERALAVFDGSPPVSTDLPLIRLTTHLARELHSFRLPEHTERFRSALSEYLHSHLWEADIQLHRHTPPLAEYRQMRPAVLGVRPLFELLPVVHARPVPAHLLRHPVVRALRDVLVDFHVLVNDLLSLSKELHAERHPLNTVLVLRAEKSLTLQQGVDVTARAAAEELDAYQRLRASLPRLGLEHPPLTAHLADLERLAADTIAWHAAASRYQTPAPIGRTDA
ncbi:terpene synthase family protein [Streptomyces sp. NPDC056255]|uniref:terpene synthase family protein n=1 Tax=Streptomyces sp. NPDC056255 TaxID=3345764 RepID=UPI0035E142C2